MSVELWTGEIEELELLATDCELKLRTEDEADDEAVVETTLLDPVLETVDPEEELAACAGAAYRLTSVVSRSLAGTEAARMTRRKELSELITAICTRL
jgi:hypothetical protein